MRRRDLLTGAAAAAAVGAFEKSGAQALVTPSGVPIIGSGGAGGFIAPASGGSNLSNGVAFTVTGSGFGTKSGSAPTLYDDMSGSNMLQSSGGLWSWTWHPQSDGWAEKYHLPTDTCPDSSLWGQTGANYVAPATPFRSRYICSALELVGYSSPGYGPGDMMIGLTLSTLVPPFYWVMSWYETYSPNWVFGTPYPDCVGTTCNDNNFKWAVYTTELTGGYGSKYWYLQMLDGSFTGINTVPKTSINDDGSAIVGRGTASPGYGIPGPAMPSKGLNGCNGWVKKELACSMTTATTGFIRMVMSQPPGIPAGAAGGTTAGQARFQTYHWDSTIGKGITDPYPGTGRTLWLGGFRRDFPQATNRQYWSDIYLDIQTSGTQRFALTNSNSLSTSTIVEYQPYTSWSSTSVTLKCQKGNLPSGTVYCWLLDDVNGNSLIGSYTMS